jgi:hypothetical protein
VLDGFTLVSASNAVPSSNLTLLDKESRTKDPQKRILSSNNGYQGDKNVSALPRAPAKSSAIFPPSSPHSSHVTSTSSQLKSQPESRLSLDNSIAATSSQPKPLPKSRPSVDKPIAMPTPVSRPLPRAGPSKVLLQSQSARDPSFSSSQRVGHPTARKSVATNFPPKAPQKKPNAQKESRSVSGPVPSQTENANSSSSSTRPFLLQKKSATQASNYLPFSTPGAGPSTLCSNAKPKAPASESSKSDSDGLPSPRALLRKRQSMPSQTVQIVKGSHDTPKSMPQSSFRPSKSSLPRALVSSATSSRHKMPLRPPMVQNPSSKRLCSF